MTLFTDPKQINIGNAVYFEYDDNIAIGKCIGLPDGLIEVDYTTYESEERKIDKFRPGFWKK